MKFIDECTVEIKAGDGGNGIVAWRHEAHVPYGGPCGGDGGNGGDIIVIGNSNINTLIKINNKKKIIAENGSNGKTNLCHGKNGKKLFIQVPLGTVIYNAATGEKICEILINDEKKIICRGGKGGHGNGWFKNPKNKIPNLHENGDKGEYLKAKFVIKFIADIGIVGLPNAGKSTLINAITATNSKIGNYPFTTIIPVIGVVNHKNQKLIIADIPGLVEDASKGKGLGHKFLKHIERCSILIHLISLDTNDNPNIVNAFNIIKKELSTYKNDVMKKNTILVANKIDVKNSIIQYNKLQKIIKKKIIAISAKNKTNIENLLDLLFTTFNNLNRNKNSNLSNESKNIKIYKVKKQLDFDNDLVISQVNKGVWQVKSKYLEYWTNKIPLDTQDNIIWYNEKIKNLNIEEKIKKLGGVSGDTLIIYKNKLLVD